MSKNPKLFELKQLKGFKFVESLKVEFSKYPMMKPYKKKAYFDSITQTIVNENELNEGLQTSKQDVLNKTAQWISEGSVWTIKSIDNHYINSAKYQPLKGSLHCQLPKKLRNAAKGLINIKNDDNECFRWCHISHLKPQEKTLRG